MPGSANWVDVVRAACLVPLPVFPMRLPAPVGVVLPGWCGGLGVMGLCWPTAGWVHAEPASLPLAPSHAP